MKKKDVAVVLHIFDPKLFSKTFVVDSYLGVCRVWDGNMHRSPTTLHSGAGGLSFNQWLTSRSRSTRDFAEDRRKKHARGQI